MCYVFQIIYNIMIWYVLNKNKCKNDGGIDPR